MSDYPDPDEEYELMYADELEMMREQEEETDTVIRPKVLPAKRSLNFSSPASKKPSLDENTLSQSIQPLPCSQETIPPNVSKEKSQDVFTNEALTMLSNIGPSKRTVDDLFGDIGDINFDDVELPSKRQKTEEENDLDLIGKILEGRRLKQLLLEPSKSDSHLSKPGYVAKDNISLNIPSWSFIPLTNSDGDRIYVKLESEQSWDASLEGTMGSITLRSMYADAWEEALRLLETEEKNQLILPSQTPMTIVDDALWVDKYRPHSYVELLSDEPVNRALLHWLHLWDKVVFKKEIKTKEPQQRNSFSKRTGNFQLTNKWKGKRETEAEMDEDGRPRLKVALLCGPPGVGKTTLAHLLAKLAGYRPVELNASDERSTDAFRTALQSATQMRSVLDADKRPNCLILDEIDGAPIATVELLVKWCTATVESGKKKAKSHPLRRPVIAICNDLYATSLRPLRPVSLIVQVSGVSTQRLASRVSSVAQCEGVWCAPHVCTALAARVDGDVRAAIHLLSFLKARAKKQLTMEDVENAAIGTKDCNKSMMQALQSIFTINDREPTAMLKVIQSAGEYDRLADGIFENYPTSRVDSRLNIACETLSWLCLHDHISAWTLRNQNYTVYSALPLCLARCHSVLATRTPPRVKFPTQAQEMYRRQQELSSVFWSVRRGCLSRAASPRADLTRDILPLLPHVLTVQLRSANVQLCSENERKALRSCAGALCDYGLQYVQQRTPDGLYAFMIEPDVYKYAFFGNEEKCRPPPAIRQAIAREQQLEIIRRNEEMSNRVSNKSKTNEKSKVSNSNEVTKSTDSKDNDKKEVRLPNHLQRLKPKAVEKTTPQVHKDFFGRIVPISQVHRADAVPDVISSSSVFYQYREGFNNAVRRNVRTKDLL